MKKTIASLSIIIALLFAGAVFADSSAVKKADTAATISAAPVSTVPATIHPVTDTPKAVVSATPVTAPPAAPATDGGWSDYFLSPVGVIALIVLITGYITKSMPSATVLGITLTQWISYAVTFAVCLFGWWQGLGIFAGIGITQVIVDTIGFGLAANGVSTLPVANLILTVVKAKNKPLVKV